MPLPEDKGTGMKSEKEQGIYIIRVTGTDHVYVGSSIALHLRFKRHLSQCRAHTHFNPILQSCFDKYGESSFEFGVLEFVEDSSELLIREQHWIDSLAGEYRIINICLVAGSRLGSTQSEDARRKISESGKGKKKPVGFGEKVSEANSGRTLSENTKRKMSEHAKARFSDKKNHPMYGKSPSAESRRKNSESHTGLQLGEKHPNAKMSNSTASEIKVRLNSGDSATVISEEMGVSRASVYDIKYGKSWAFLEV